MKKLTTVAPDSKWLRALREKGFTARTKYISEQANSLAKLKSKLLSMGGHAVILPKYEEDVNKIIFRGVLLRKYKMMKGEECQCHRNSVLLWEANKNKVDLCTGYALSFNGGIWRQHSWCVERSTNMVVETTVGRIGYFGFKLNEKESDKFLYENE